MVKEVFFVFLIGLIFLSFFLLTSIQIASLPEVVNFQQKLSGVHEGSGLETEEIIKVTSQALDYVHGRDSSSLPYTSREMFHLGEVRNLFRKARLFWLISAVASFLILFWSSWASLLWRERFKRVSKGITFTLLLFDLVTIFFFSFFFEGFHRIFFQPGTWAFEENALLIRLFPYRFWFCQTFLVLGLTTLFSTNINLLLFKILSPRAEH
jgi:integral membrane protein (TIGR01906 family)